MAFSSNHSHIIMTCKDTQDVNHGPTCAKHSGCSRPFLGTWHSVHQRAPGSHRAPTISERTHLHGRAGGAKRRYHFSYRDCARGFKMSKAFIVGVMRFEVVFGPWIIRLNAQLISQNVHCWLVTEKMMMMGNRCFSFDSWCFRFSSTSHFLGKPAVLISDTHVCRAPRSLWFNRLCKEFPDFPLICMEILTKTMKLLHDSLWNTL